MTQPSETASQIDKLSTGAKADLNRPLWWANLTSLLTSPLLDRAHKVAALNVAAKRAAQVGPGGAAESVVVSGGADMLGRRGVTLRVPYWSRGEATTADLTFDPMTGDLLQRVVASPRRGPGTLRRQ